MKCVVRATVCTKRRRAHRADRTPDSEQRQPGDDATSLILTLFQQSYAPKLEVGREYLFFNHKSGRHIQHGNGESVMLVDGEERRGLAVPVYPPDRGGKQRVLMAEVCACFSFATTHRISKNAAPPLIEKYRLCSRAERRRRFRTSQEPTGRTAGLRGGD